MASQLIKVPPTRNSLLNLKRHVQFLEQGHELLERKRELLTRLVYQRLGLYRERRQAACEALSEAYRWLSICYLRMGSRALEQAGLGIEPSLQISILPKRNLGVEYPAISAHIEPLRPVGLLGTDSSFDDTRIKLTRAAMLLARLGEVETALDRLVAEQRKAQKRVNALKYNIIPRYRRTIGYIESVLEEEERSTLFQIKRLKDRSTAARRLS